VNDVEVVLHRGAVSAAEAAGDEEEQRHGSGQPAAGQDAVPDIDRSARQHAAVPERTREDLDGWSVTYHSPFNLGH